MYPDSHIIPTDNENMDFTTIEHDEIDVSTFENEETTVPAPSSATSTTPPSTLDLDSTPDSTYTVASRRHHYPNLLPLLTMVRYVSTIHLSEIITESFASPGIHHCAVS